MTMANNTRNFKMSDGDIIQRADMLEYSILRDSAAFAERAVTAPRIALMTNARTAFANFSTDDEYKGWMMKRTQDKDSIRTDLEMAIRSIRNMADIQYRGVGAYKIFGFEDLGNQTDNNLHRVAKRVARIATMLLDELSAQGLTTEKITALSTLNGSFDTAIDELATAVETREYQTLLRVRLANELWGYMSELASIGKSIFEDTDEARYNDYVLYDA